MKLAVIGSRTFNDLAKLTAELNQMHLETPISLLISGGAQGADQMAEYWAKHNQIKTLIFLPQWKLHGRSAGVIRNRQIIESCDTCVAFWDGASKGTASSIKLAQDAVKPIKIVRI